MVKFLLVVAIIRCWIRKSGDEGRDAIVKLGIVHLNKNRFSLLLPKVLLIWAIGVMGWGVGGNLLRRFGLGAFVLEKLLLRENLKQGSVLNKLRRFILQIIEV